MVLLILFRSISAFRGSNQPFAVIATQACLFSATKGPKRANKLSEDLLAEINHDALNITITSITTTRQSSIEMEIKNRFADKMQNSNVFLLKDFDTYASHLPRRMFQGDRVNSKNSLRLYEVEYFVRPTDLQYMSDAIEDKTLAKSDVRYLSAPTAYGKTASVLPAFLKSKTATHYLYIPFSNHGNQHFQATPSMIGTENPEIAEVQGAAFMVQCVKNLLEDKKVAFIPIIDEAEIYRKGISTSVFQTYVEELEAYLTEKLGANSSVWFHVDEHGKMIHREYVHNTQRALTADAFFQGVMKVLTFARGNNRVIATYTKPPTAIPSSNTAAAICRRPIALPRLDIDQAMAYVPELNIGNNVKFTTPMVERLWSILRVRLAMKIEEYGMLFFFHRKSNKVKDFLMNFQKIVQQSNNNHNNTNSLQIQLMELNNLCKTNGLWKRNDNEDAAKLLVGVREGDQNSNWLFEKHIESDIIVIEPDQLITCSLHMLLKAYDPNIEPYNTGRDLFLSVLQHDQPDLLSGTPLECAYIWTLSCESAVKGFIEFGPEVSFKIQCKKLVKARLFDKTNTPLTAKSLKQLQKNVIYYTDKSRDHEQVSAVTNETTTRIISPPLADLFFLTENNELVLIDITDGNKAIVEEKLSQKANFLKVNGRKQIPLQNGEYIKEIRFIILALSVDDKFKKNEGLDIVCGKDARASLGGLAQILPWLVNEKKSANNGKLCTNPLNLM